MKGNGQQVQPGTQSFRAKQEQEQEQEQEQNTVHKQIYLLNVLARHSAQPLSFY